MDIRETKINHPIVRRIVAIRLFELANMISAKEVRKINRDTISRQIYYLIADDVAKDLWKQMKDMGGSVNG